MRGVKRHCSAEHGEDYSSPADHSPHIIPGAYPNSPSRGLENASTLEIVTAAALDKLASVFARPINAINAIKQYFAPRQYKLEPVIQPNGIRPFKKRILEVDAIDTVNEDSIDDTLREIDSDEHVERPAYQHYTKSPLYADSDDFDFSPEWASTPTTQEAWEALRRTQNISPTPCKRASSRALGNSIRRIPTHSSAINRRKHYSRSPMGSPDIWMSDEVACPDDPFVVDNIFEPKFSPTNSNHTPTPSPENSKVRKMLTPQSVRRMNGECDNLAVVQGRSSDDMHTLSMSYKEKIASVKLNASASSISSPHTRPDTYPLFVAQSGPIPAASGSEEAYENDLSELPDAPAKKSVGWADFVHAKPFFIDSTIAEMQDSFLEELKQGHDFETALANTSPMIFPNDDAGPHADAVASDNAVHVDYTNVIEFANDISDSPNHDLIHDLNGSASEFVEYLDDDSSDFDDDPDGPSSDFDDDPDGPSSDFDDDPEEKSLTQNPPHKTSSINISRPEGVGHGDSALDESLLSRELAEDLSQGFKARLQLDETTSTSAKVPPTAPAVPVTPPLISSLTDEEDAILKGKSKECDEGKRPQAMLTESRGLGRASLTAHDFSRLLPSLFNGSPMGWLNDEIINEYLAILVHFFWDAEGYKGYKNTTSGPSIDVMSSYWYKQKPAGLKRWFSKKNLLGQNFLKARLILLPICHQAHWRLAAIKPREKRIIYLDSLSYPEHEVTNKILEALPEVLGDLYVPNEWTVEPTQQSIQQDNASDCGVFTLLNALVLVRGEEHNRVICVDGMMDARRRIAITLLAGEPTGELD